MVDIAAGNIYKRTYNKNPRMLPNNHEYMTPEML